MWGEVNNTFSLSYSLSNTLKRGFRCFLDTSVGVSCCLFFSFVYFSEDHPSVNCYVRKLTCYWQLSFETFRFKSTNQNMKTVRGTVFTSQHLLSLKINISAFYTSRILICLFNWKPWKTLSKRSKSCQQFIKKFQLAKLTVMQYPCDASAELEKYCEEKWIIPLVWVIH